MLARTCQALGRANTPARCLARSNEIGAAKSEKVVLQPLHGIALFPPFIFDVLGCAPESIRHEHVALAYIAGEPLHMFPKTISEHFIPLRLP